MGESITKLKVPKPFYEENYKATCGHKKQRAFQIGPIIWLQLDFLGLMTTMFRQVGSATYDIYTLHQPVSSQQKK